MDCEKRVLTGNTGCMEEARCDAIGHFLMHHLPFSAERIVEEAAGSDTIGQFLMHRLPFSAEQNCGQFIRLLCYMDVVVRCMELLLLLLFTHIQQCPLYTIAPLHSRFR